MFLTRSPGPSAHYLVEMVAGRAPAVHVLGIVSHVHFFDTAGRISDVRAAVSPHLRHQRFPQRLVLLGRVGVLELGGVVSPGEVPEAPPRGEDRDAQGHRDHPEDPELGAQDGGAAICLPIKHAHAEERGDEGGWQEDGCDQGQGLHRHAVQAGLCAHLGAPVVVQLGGDDGELVVCHGDLSV